MSCHVSQINSEFTKKRGYTGCGFCTGIVQPSDGAAAVPSLQAMSLLHVVCSDLPA